MWLHASTSTETGCTSERETVSSFLDVTHAKGRRQRLQCYSTKHNKPGLQRQGYLTLLSGAGPRHVSGRGFRHGKFYRVRVTLLKAGIITAASNLCEQHSFRKLELCLPFSHQTAKQVFTQLYGRVISYQAKPTTAKLFQQRHVSPEKNNLCHIKHCCRICPFPCQPQQQSSVGYSGGYRRLKVQSGTLSFYGC